jgi:hypothetical protein
MMASSVVVADPHNVGTEKRKMDAACDRLPRELGVLCDVARANLCAVTPEVIGKSRS